MKRISVRHVRGGYRIFEVVGSHNGTDLTIEWPGLFYTQKQARIEIELVLRLAKNKMKVA